MFIFVLSALALAAPAGELGQALADELSEGPALLATGRGVGDRVEALAARLGHEPVRHDLTAAEACAWAGALELDRMVLVRNQLRGWQVRTLACQGGRTVLAERFVGRERLPRVHAPRVVEAPEPVVRVQTEPEDQQAHAGPIQRFMMPPPSKETGRTWLLHPTPRRGWVVSGSLAVGTRLVMDCSGEEASGWTPIMTCGPTVSAGAGVIGSGVEVGLLWREWVLSPDLRLGVDVSQGTQTELVDRSEIPLPILSGGLRFWVDPWRHLWLGVLGHWRGLDLAKSLGAGVVMGRLSLEARLRLGSGAIGQRDRITWLRLGFALGRAGNPDLRFNDGVGPPGSEPQDMEPVF